MAAADVAGADVAAAIVAGAGAGADSSAADRNANILLDTRKTNYQFLILFTSSSSYTITSICFCNSRCFTRKNTFRTNYSKRDSIGDFGIRRLS